MSDHEKSDEFFSKDKSASRLRSRSATPVKRKKFNVSKSRSGTPSKRKHSKEFSPLRSRTPRKRMHSEIYFPLRPGCRIYQQHRRSRSRGRRDVYDESFSKHKSASRSKSRSDTPVEGMKFNVSNSRSRTPSKRKHFKKSSPSRSRSRSYRKYSRSQSRGRRDAYDERREFSRSRNNKRSRYNRRSPSRSPPSKRRRMEDRENPKKSKCIGLFGMSLYTDERTIRDVFERYGRIDGIQIIYDYQSGRSRGFAFVNYEYIEDAVSAKENASGMEIDGRKVRVDYSITERAHTPTPGTHMGFKGGYRDNERGNHRSPPPTRRGGRGRNRYRSPSRDRR